MSHFFLFCVYMSRGFFPRNKRGKEGKEMSKKIAALILSVVFIFSAAMVAGAEGASAPVSPASSSEGEPGIQPLFEYTNITAVSLSISNGTATCSARLNGYSGITTKIEIKMTLQKKFLLWWNTEESWSTTINDFYGALTKTASVDSGTYRVKVDFTVYSGSKSEEITTYSQEKEY